MAQGSGRDWTVQHVEGSLHEQDAAVRMAQVSHSATKLELGACTFHWICDLVGKGNGVFGDPYGLSVPTPNV